MAKIRGKEGKFRDSDILEIKNDYEKFKELYFELNKKYEKIVGQEHLIPISAFNCKLTVLQVVVKYLHEQKGLKFSEIGEKLNRNSRIIWKAYQLSKKTKIEINSVQMIPISIFSNRKLSMSENLVVYLKKSMKYSEIAKILNRNERTIWTTYNRARVKNEK